MAAKGKSVGIAFSGGAARGFAHLGVLKEFERASLQIDMIAGTSSGALVGVLYASGLSLERIEAIGRSLTWLKDIVSPVLPTYGILSTAKLGRFIRETLPVKRFSDLKIPLSVMTVDILSRRECVFSTGRLDIAIQASCSVPGIFKPVAYRDMLLVDGGIMSNLPARIVRRMGADIVIGVDVNKKGRLFDRIDNVFKVLLQSHYIMMETNTRNEKSFCDFVIEPDVGKGGFLSLEKADEFIRCGEKAARLVVKEIKGVIEGDV